MAKAPKPKKVKLADVKPNSLAPKLSNDYLESTQPFLNQGTKVRIYEEDQGMQPVFLLPFFLGPGAAFARSKASQSVRNLQAPKTGYHGGYGDPTGVRGAYVSSNPSYAAAYVRGDKRTLKYGEVGEYSVDLSKIKNIELIDMPSKKFLSNIRTELSRMEKYAPLNKNTIGFRNVNKSSPWIERVDVTKLTPADKIIFDDLLLLFGQRAGLKYTNKALAPGAKNYPVPKYKSSGVKPDIRAFFDGVNPQTIQWFRSKGVDMFTDRKNLNPLTRPIDSEFFIIKNLEKIKTKFPKEYDEFGMAGGTKFQKLRDTAYRKSQDGMPTRASLKEKYMQFEPDDLERIGLANLVKGFGYKTLEVTGKGGGIIAATTTPTIPKATNDFFLDSLSITKGDNPEIDAILQKSALENQKTASINPETGLEEFNLKDEDVITLSRVPPIDVQLEEYKKREADLEKSIADNRLVTKEAQMSSLSGEGYRDPRIVATTGVEAIDNFAISPILPTDYKEGRVVGQRLSDKDLNQKYYWDNELSQFFPEGMGTTERGSFIYGNYTPLEDNIEWLGPRFSGKREEQKSKATQIHELVHRAAFRSGYMQSKELENYLQKQIIFTIPGESGGIKEMRNPMKTSDRPMSKREALDLVGEVLAHSYQPELKGKKNKKALENAIRMRARLFGIEDEYGINRLIDSIKPLQKSFIKYLKENPEPEKSQRIVDEVKASLNPETGLEEFNLKTDGPTKKQQEAEVEKLKKKREAFEDELKFRAGENLTNILKEFGLVDDAYDFYKTTRRTEDAIENIKYQLTILPKEEFAKFQDRLEDDIALQLENKIRENLPFGDKVTKALKKDDPEAYLETEARNEAIDKVLEEVPLGLRRNLLGIAFKKQKKFGNSKLIFEALNPYEGDPTKDVTFRYSKELGPESLNVKASTKERESDYIKYTNRGFTGSISKKSGRDAKASLGYSKDFNIGNQNFSIDASINELLDTNLALSYSYKGPRGGEVKASYGGKPVFATEKIEDAILDGREIGPDSIDIANKANIEFKFPLGGRRKKSKRESYIPTYEYKTLDDYMRGADLEKTVYAASINPETNLEEFNLKGKPSLGKVIDTIEDKGRKGDTELVHVTPGEMIITPEMVNDDPEFKAILERKYAEYGINPNQATVGTGRASVNTKTGLEEFNLSQQDVLKEVASQSIVKSYLENPQGFSRLAGQGLAADPSKPFREGIAAGTAQVKGDFKQYAALYNLLTGKEDEAKIKLEKADALYAEADEITREYTKFENAFDSLSDLGEYSGLQLGKLVPQILTMLGTGFGSAVVYGLGKQGVKSATKKYLQKKSTRLLNKDKAGIPLTKGEQQFLKEGAQGTAYLKVLKDNKIEWNRYAIDKDASKLVRNLGFGTTLRKGGTFGLNAQTAFWAGSFNQSLAIGAAQSAQEYRDQNIELTDEEAALAIMYGVPQALLDTASEFIFFKGALKVAAGELKKASTREGKKQAASVITDILKASAIQAGKSSLIEGATEMGQEGVLIAQRLYDPLGGGKYADATYDREMIKMRVLESGFVGALAGGARGAGGGVIAKSYDLLANKELDRSEIVEAQERIREQGSPAIEPMADVRDQIDDMFNPDIPRNVVFMPNFDIPSLEALGSSNKILGAAGLDIASIKAKYPTLGVLEVTNSKNPGIFFYDDTEGSAGKDIIDAINAGKEVTDTYLKEISGYETEQNATDPYVVVTKNANGNVVKSQSVPVDEDGSTTTLDKAVAKAEQDYPVDKGYSTVAMDKQDFLDEQNKRMQDESPQYRQTEFDFVDAEEDPDIKKAQQDEEKLNVKDVKSPDPEEIRKRQKLRGAAATKTAKYEAYKILQSEQRYVTRDPISKKAKSKLYKHNNKFQFFTDAEGVVYLKTLFDGDPDVSASKAKAILEALSSVSRLNVFAPDIVEKANGLEVTFRFKGFTPFATQAEVEGPRYNKDRIAEQSDERLTQDSDSTLPDVASLDSFDDVKSFLFTRTLLGLSSRPLNAKGAPVSPRAKRSWEEGGTSFREAGFFTPLSALTPEQKTRLTPTTALRKELRALLTKDEENQTSIPNGKRLADNISKLQRDEDGNFVPDIPSVVYQAIIEANVLNPDAELNVIRTDRDGEPVPTFKFVEKVGPIQVNPNTGKKTESTTMKVPNTENYFYRVVELTQNDSVTAIRQSVKKSANTAYLIERPLKNPNQPPSFDNRWNSSPYAQAFRVVPDPLQKDPEIIRRNKDIFKNREARFVSMTQLLSGEALRRLSAKTMGTTGLITQEEYNKIRNLEDNSLVFDNFVSLLLSLKQTGLILEYGVRYPKQDGKFVFTDEKGKSTRFSDNEGYKPVVEQGDSSLKTVVIPKFKNNTPLPPSLDNSITNGSVKVDDLLPDPTRRLSEYQVRNTVSAFVPRQTKPIETTFELKDITVISGGQTGADIIFSQAAKDAGLKTGGLMPKGFVTEDGRKPNYAEEFNMQEDPDTGKGKKMFLSRTEKNVQNSDGTIIVVNDPENMTPGAKQTEKFAIQNFKPSLVVTPDVTAKEILDFITKNNIKVLNGAGSRGSTLKNQNKLKNTLAEVFAQESVVVKNEPTLKETTIPNPHIKEAKILFRLLNKLPQLKRSIETILERNTPLDIENTIYELGLENSDVAESDLQFDKEKGPDFSQQEAIDRSIIRGILGLTSKEDTHANYPFENVKGGLDFIEQLETRLDEDFYRLNDNIPPPKTFGDYQEVIRKAKYSPFVTGENETVRFKAPQGSNVQNYQTQSDFEIVLEAAIDTIQLVDQTLEAQAEIGAQPPVVNENLEVTYTDVVGIAESDTDMFATSSIVQEVRKLAGERGVVITDQAKYGLDATKLSGPGRVDEFADKWKDYKPPLKSGKTTFGPKIKEFFNEKFVGFPIPNQTLSFTSIEALDQTMRQRFKNTRDITVLSVNDKLSTMKLTSSQNFQVAKIRNKMIRNREPAKFIGFPEDKDLILLNPNAYGGKPRNADDVALRQTGLYFELAHEFGHSIIEDQISDLFGFNNKELRKDFIKAFETARTKLEAKEDMKYSDPETGPHEFLADQIAALAMADISLKEDNPIRKQLGLQNAEGVNKYSFDDLLTKRLRAFLRRILTKLKTYINTIHAQYNNRFKVARDVRGDVDSRFLKSLSKTLSTFRGKSNNNFMNKLTIMDAANTAFDENKKFINKKQAKKLKSYLARQASALYNAELGLKRVFGHPAEHWSMKYMFSPAASYLTKVSRELGEAFYGLTQSEDDFGYKRTYLIIQNQKMSDLLSILPTDKKGRPDFEALQATSAIAEDYTQYSNEYLQNSKDPVEKTAYEIRLWLDDFFDNYLQDPNNPVEIGKLQDFFPRLWNMVELRRDPKAREVLAKLLFDANKNKKDKETGKPLQMFFEDRTKPKGLIVKPVNDKAAWELFVDAWLGTDEDNDSNVQFMGEDAEFNADQNKKRTQDTQNLSIGMAKSRDEWFLALETGVVREAERKEGVTLLSTPENALRRYVQDTVKKIEYAKNVRTAFRIEDYNNMVRIYGKDNVPFRKPKKINIAPKGETPIYTEEYDVYGAKAAEVMISRIEDPAKRQGARKGVEALLGKTGAGMSPFMRQVNSWGLLVNWFGYLSFAVLASAPDMAGPLFRGKGLIKPSDILKEAIIPWTKDAAFAKQFALDIGVVTHESITSMFIDAAELGFMNETTQKYAGFYFKAIGLDWYTNFTRTFAAGLGEQFIFRLATSKQNRTTARWLAELGLTAEDVKYWHNQNKDKGRAQRDFSTPQGEKVRMAIAQFVEESILRPGAAERPIWASNPYFALIFQLKSFFYAYGKTIIGGVYREATNKYADAIADGKKPSSALFGATAPVAIGVSALFIMTALGLELREFIKYLANGGDSTKFRTNDMDWGEYMFEMTDRAGILGPLGILVPIFEAPGYGDSMILEALGPMAGRVDDLLVQGNIATNPEDTFWSFVPLASGLELDWF